MSQPERQTMQIMLAKLALHVLSECMCNHALPWHQLDSTPILYLWGCLSLDNQ